MIVIERTVNGKIGHNCIVGVPVFVCVWLIGRCGDDDMR